MRSHHTLCFSTMLTRSTDPENRAAPDRSTSSKEQEHLHDILGRKPQSLMLAWAQSYSVRKFLQFGCWQVRCTIACSYMYASAGSLAGLSSLIP